MRDNSCQHRAAVRRAVETDSWSPGLEAHLEQCRGCRETFRVAGWLRGVAADGIPSPPLRHPSQLWWKAQIIRKLTERQELAERAARPSVWGQVVGLLAVAAAASMALAWLAPSALRELPGWIMDPALLESVARSPGLLLAVALSVGPIAGIIALCLLWREA